jgi:hypothetical protein
VTSCHGILVGGMVVTGDWSHWSQAHRISREITEEEGMYL